MLYTWRETHMKYTIYMQGSKTYENIVYHPEPYTKALDYYFSFHYLLLISPNIYSAANLKKSTTKIQSKINA